ncbi:uncharacterized protein LOC107040826 isoform X1 [Diachasma alloeum]|uniref:uncharacterized protein LOC107040826 isoform X1 n=1 Tax=Diachasma alloeum TaxID=454923 RepID=UPI0007382631|nr:uncharacterized protein LOC107040826 isoform X1 [Diachasma alloeum]
MSALPFALRLSCCCWCWLTFIVILLKSSCVETSDIVGSDNTRLFWELWSYEDLDVGRDEASRSRTSRRAQGVYDEEGDGDLSYDGEEDYIEGNSTEKGRFLGSLCDDTCSPNLQHVVCDAVSGKCECEKNYPVQLGPTKGCAKPKKLGEQCFYRASCTFVDQHATCTQVQHNAICECDTGYHRVVLSRPTKKTFCAEDLVLIKTDLATLLGVASGIAVLTGLICFVLKLFSRARYSEPRHYANAHHTPPMLFSNDAGIPLTLSGRPSSRSSQRSGDGPLSCGAFTRRPSSGGSRGPLVPASRAGAARAAAILLISCHLQAAAKGKKHRRTLSDVAEGSNGLGSRRPSLASIHSSTSSARSYSARRLEKERNDKEQRLALQELRLARQREQEAQMQQLQTQPTPSPRTPHSTDELLPAVEESREEILTVVASEMPSVSRIIPQKSSANNHRSSIPVSLASTSLTVHRSMNATETAFTAPACTSALKNNTSANCSSVVDIFES